MKVTGQSILELLANHDYKDDKSKHITDTLRRFGSIAHEHADDVGSYGQNLIAEYAKVMIKEVGEYEVLVNARPRKKSSKPKKSPRPKSSKKTNKRKKAKK